MCDNAFERARAALRWTVVLSAFLPIWGAAAEPPINILFVGNSFTHGRYEPVRGYNAGFGADNVHDLLCPSPATCSAAEQGSQIDPAETRPPGATLSAQLAYLQANPSSQYKRARSLRRSTRNLLAIYARGAPPLFGFSRRGEQRNADRLSQQYWQRER